MPSPPSVFHTFWFTQIEILPEYYRDAINVSVEILTIFTERNIFITRLSPPLYLPQSRPGAGEGC